LSPPDTAGAVVPADVPGAIRRWWVDTGEGVRLAAVEVQPIDAGPGDAPVVVIAHGVGSSARFVVEAFAAPVLAAGGRLVTYDLRGHGSSSPTADPAAHRLDAHVGDLAALVAMLERPPVVLGGVSLGGHAAVRAADRGVATSAVLACLPAWTGRATPGEGPHAAVAAEVRRVGIHAVIERLRAESTMAPWLRETLVTDYTRHDPASLTAALLALDGGDAPTEDELTHLGTLPLGVVGWPDDPGHPLAVAQRWAALAPRSSLGQLGWEELIRTRERLGEMAVATLGRLGTPWPGARRPPPAAG
jgi:pimeloyl-ACP methyl ester carboxylesterase